MQKFRLTLLESKNEVVEAFNDYFNPLGIDTWLATGYNSVIDSCLDGKTFCVVISIKILTIKELVETFQKKLSIPIILIEEEGATLKITRFKKDQEPSSIHCSNFLKRTDPETWKIVWDEIQKLIT